MTINVGSYKLVTGELIVGRVKETVQEEDFIVLNKPFSIHVIPNRETNSYQLGMMPYNPTNPEGDEKFYKHAIVSAPASLPKEFVDAYIQQSTGIEIASSVGEAK